MMKAIEKDVPPDTSKVRTPMFILACAGTGLLSFALGDHLARNSGGGRPAIKIASPRVDQCQRDLADLRQMLSTAEMMNRHTLQQALLSAMATIEDQTNRETPLRASLRRKLCQIS